MHLLSALGRLRDPGDRGRYLKFYERKILGRFLASPENAAQPAKSRHCCFKGLKCYRFSCLGQGQSVTVFQ